MGVNKKGPLSLRGGEGLFGGVLLANLILAVTYKAP